MIDSSALANATADDGEDGDLGTVISYTLTTRGHK